MKKIKKIVYEIGGEEAIVNVDYKTVSNILYDEGSQTFKVFNADGFLFLEVHGVKEIHYDTSEAYEDEVSSKVGFISVRDMSD